jgi:hypothetical protein
MAKSRCRLLHPATGTISGVAVAAYTSGAAVQPDSSLLQRSLAGTRYRRLPRACAPPASPRLPAPPAPRSPQPAVISLSSHGNEDQTTCPPNVIHGQSSVLNRERITDPKGSPEPCPLPSRRPPRPPPGARPAGRRPRGPLNTPLHAPLHAPQHPLPTCPRPPSRTARPAVR